MSREGKKFRQMDKAAAFLKNLLLVIRERSAAAGQIFSVEWKYYVIRAQVWSDYKELSAAEYDYATGQLHSNIDPQDVNQNELYLQVLETNKLRRLADRYHIPMPDERERGNYDSISWDYDNREPKYLTVQGLRKLLPSIRAAQKERREAAGFWFGITVGVIGALTGLASALG